MTRRFIPHKKLIKLQEIVGFLDKYETEEGEEHVVGESLKDEDIDWGLTWHLQELGKLNKRRDALIKSLT